VNEIGPAKPGDHQQETDPCRLARQVNKIGRLNPATTGKKRTPAGLPGR